MAAAAILDLFELEIAQLDPPSPKTLPKHEVDRITRCRDMVICIWWGHMEPPFWGEGEVVGGSAIAPLERAMVVSYRLSIVTVALSANLRSNVSDAQINRGVGHFGPKFRFVPLGADPSCWGCKERTSQANKR